MNKFFIKSSLDEIKVLQDSNMDTISNILKDYSKLLKTNKIEYEYSNFLKDFASYNITQKKIIVKAEHFKTPVKILFFSSVF